jgi:hypothetical protein
MQRFPSDIHTCHSNNTNNQIACMHLLQLSKLGFYWRNNHACKASQTDLKFSLHVCISSVSPADVYIIILIQYDIYRKCLSTKYVNCKYR